ncbi:MAG: hypothetical protein ACFE0S_02625 [Rhodospirillales bacterium]
MARQNTLRLAESFRHAITYLIGEANRSGFDRVGASLEKVNEAVDEELDLRGFQESNNAPHGDRDLKAQSMREN